MTSRLLDLPENVRMHIYGFVLGFRVIHIDGYSRVEGNSKTDSGFTYCICDSSLTLHPVRKYDEIEVYETLYNCTIPVIYPCECFHVDNTATVKSLDFSLLRTCQQIYTEARNVFLAYNLFTFTTWFGFTSFLLEPLGGSLRAAAVTKLTLLVDPKTPQAHFLNETLGELYLPDGTMSSPESHFPALKMVHLLIGLSSGCERPTFIEQEKWSSFLWIWAFAYFAIEELNDVSVAISSDYVVRNRDWDGKGNENEIGTDMEWRRPSHEELKEYEYEVRHSLLKSWMGGDQDDVELRHSGYDMRTRNIDFWNEEP
jgi:hypothetical protein